jgi:AcrR family transcriptional regulator
MLVVVNMKLQTAPRRYTQTLRAQSAQATGKQILDAFLARLMTQWFDEITLDSIAEEAGVTVQTVLRRFGDKEGLLANAVKILAVQIRARRGTATADIDSLVHGLIEDYEATGDAVIRLLALEPRHRALKESTRFRPRRTSPMDFHGICGGAGQMRCRSARGWAGCFGRHHRCVYLEVAAPRHRAKRDRNGHSNEEPDPHHDCRY